ncbi:MAG: molybdopterin-guanine dinucleotide biosynthesis protein B [bacterium]
MGSEFGDGRIIGVVGWKGSGKTTVVEGIVSMLRSRGFVVGTVKHAMEFTLASPGTDSFRHIDAGASRCVVVGGDSTFIIQSQSEDLNLILSRHLSMCDFVVVEGFKHLLIPKIVVASDEGVPEGLSNVVAFVGDVKDPSIPSFDIKRLDLLYKYLLERGIIKPARFGIELVIDGQVVKMNEFVKKSFSGVVRGFIKALKNVKDPQRVELYLRFPSEEKSEMIDLETKKEN